MSIQEFRISVVVVGRDGLQSLAPILACLREQTIAHQMQVIAVVSRDRAGDADVVEWHGSFAEFRTVAVVQIGNRGKAAAAGVREAAAPVLAFTENHCFPKPDWAEQMLEGYDNTVAGVAPSVLNANPESLLSWAIYGGGYARFSAEQAAGDLDEMPLHNTSYRRELLIPLENNLEELLSDERNLQRRLLANGGRFRFHPEAKTQHINEATWGLVLGLNLINGRRFGGNRSAGWSLSKRMVYALAFPILSVNVLRGTIHQIEPVNARPRFGILFLLTIWIQSLAHTLGEAGGYLFGPRDEFDFLDDEEFMILERLAGRPLSDRRLADFVSKAVPILPRVLGVSG